MPNVIEKAHTTMLSDLSFIYDHFNWALSSVWECHNLPQVHHFLTSQKKKKHLFPHSSVSSTFYIHSFSHFQLKTLIFNLFMEIELLKESFAIFHQKPYQPFCICAHVTVSSL